MRKTARAGGIAIAAVALGLALAGCGSEEKKTEATTTQPTTSAPAPANQAAKPNKTIVDYIKENGIVETPIKRGDPGSPTVNLPIPPGWEDAGPRTPQWAWGQVIFADPAAAADPSSITALMSKLTGPVDPAKIIEFTPGEIKNLPGYTGDSGSASKLGGFDAWQVGGTYTKNGVKRAIAQKTVVIPGQDALFVMQLNADGPEPQMGVLVDAMNVIDQNTTITA
jgi:hypothetical protein